MWARSYCHVVRQGGSGADILAGPLGNVLVSVTITDTIDQQSDGCEIVFADPGRRIPLPRKGELFTVAMGWLGAGPLGLAGAAGGLFAVQRLSHRGAAGRGEQLLVELRAADFVEKLKGKRRQAWEAGTTAGQIFSDLAGEAGLGTSIDPDIAARPVGYRLRWDQSAIDAATELAEELGATVKPAGGKLVVMKRGAGAAGSGQPLQDVLVTRRGGFGWEIEIEPRPLYGKVTASWLDPATGRRKLVSVETGLDGPVHALQHPFQDEATALQAAESEAYGLGAASGTGFFERPGAPRARAGANVIASGFGEGIDGRWMAETVTHTRDKRRGFVTSIDVSAGKEAKVT